MDFLGQFFIAAMLQPKLSIFSTDMLWESCSKIDIEQLSHIMCVTHMAVLAIFWKKNTKMTTFSFLSKLLAKLAIFSTDML